MNPSRKQRWKSRKIKIDLAELEIIVNATSSRILTEKEHGKLQEAHQLLVQLAIAPSRNDESAAAVLEEQADGEESPEKEAAKRKGGNGRRPRDAFKNATVVKVPHTKLQSGQPCSCGCGKLYPLKRPIHFRHIVGQAQFEVTLYEQEQLRCNGCGEVFTAPLPEGVGPEPYHATAVSMIALSKYGMGLPFNRQALFLDLLGTPIAATTQYEVVDAGAKKIEPAFDHLVELAAQGKVGYFDDTSMKILDFVREEGDDRTGLHTTGVVSVHEAFEIAVFFTGRNHAGENRAALLKKRDPDLPGMIQMSDALSSNFTGIDLMTASELIAYCLTHGRRNFVKIVDSFPDDCRHVIRAIGTVYHHDDLSRKQGHTPEERLAFHQEKSRPVMDDLKTWLDERIVGKKAEPNSTLGRAIQYMRKHWQPLTLFLRVADAPLDSNAVERILKKVVLHRKNSLFYRSVKGAKVGDIYMSLIQTCQLNHANPFDYLTVLQQNCEALKSEPGKWMPWTFRDTIASMGSPPGPPLGDIQLSKMAAA